MAEAAICCRSKLYCAFYSRQVLARQLTLEAVEEGLKDSAETFRKGRRWIAHNIASLPRFKLPMLFIDDLNRL